MLPYETKDFQVELKVEPNQRIVEGYLAQFGNVDETDDKLHKGAFKKTVKERLPRNLLKYLYQHSSFHPLGNFSTLKEDDYGLFFQSKIVPTQLGNDTLLLMSEGVLDRNSIGFTPVRTEVDEKELGPGGWPIRHLHEVKLYEGSIVTFAANEGAITTTVKRYLEGDLDEPLTQAILHLQAVQRALRPPDLKKVVPFQDLPLAPRERAWDAGAARSRVRAWAGASDGPTPKYRRAFLWYDSENADNFGAYKLPVADIVDGTLTAVPSGVFAAAGVMSGARGGVNIPSSDLGGIRSHLDRYYAKMRTSFDDEGIISPWKKQSEEEQELKSRLASENARLSRILTSIRTSQ